MSSDKPDQIQASVAAALSRLRGDLGPSGAAAPRIDEQQESERARPANDVRGDPFFRSVQSPPPEAGMTTPGRAPIPMTPFPRMQAAREPDAEPPSATPPDSPYADADAPVEPLEPATAIDMPDMPDRPADPDLGSMPEPHAMAPEPPEPAPQPVVQPAAPPPRNNPLSRVMRGTAAPGSGGPAQPDLLSDLPPPPISEPLMADTESSAMRRRRRNRRLLALAAVIVVIAIGAWLWTGSKPSTDVPVIAAETTPEKVKPAEEGGLQVQNQDVQVLDPSARTQGETVMPAPEQPITPPAATTPGEAAGAEQAPTVVDGASGDSPATAETPTADAQPTPGVPLVETPLPALEENAPTPAPQPAEPATAESAPAAPAVAAPESTQAAGAPATTEPAQMEGSAAEGAATEGAAEAAPVTTEPATTPAPEPAQAAQPEAPEPAAAQEAAATPSAPTPVAATGNARVQLAAGKSEAAVQTEWTALQKAHPQLLGDLSLTVERVDKGAAGVFYRLQAGPLADKAAARELCASLKGRGQDCIVVSK